MKPSDKAKIEAYREKGVPYAEIAEVLSLPLNTVKSYCKRHDLGSRRERTAENISLCLQCGAGIPQIPHRKVKKFCSNQCRNLWQRSHPTEIQCKSEQIFICPVCKSEFSAYRSSNQKYCSVSAMENRRRSHMSNEKIQNVMQYQTVMVSVRSLLSNGIITKTEYHKIDTIMTRKYAISSCSIFR